MLYFKPLLFCFKSFDEVDFYRGKLVLGALSEFVIFRVSFKSGDLGRHTSCMGQQFLARQRKGIIEFFIQSFMYIGTWLLA